ncbi:hypothetical protein, partial [Bacillus cereus]|uniref:hypothetical protein n=1 Tax=Bacillus cereus TaxID=1396 RepID=UPI0034D4FD26
SSDSLLWSQNGTNIFNKSNRSVGVGTSTPVSKLQVNGGVRSDSVITPYITSASGDLSVNGASNLILTGLAGAVELYSNSG